MNHTHYIAAILVLFFAVGNTSCRHKTKQQNDELYSRHLQRQVKLTVINTPVPDDKSEINLLVFNDGQELEAMHLKDLIDSLYKEKKIEPLVVVGVYAENRKQEYGISDKTNTTSIGAKADSYDSFFNNELYPFAKTSAGVRKFKSVTIAGFGAGALSAMDLAWNHPDKIIKAGLFSGAFSRKDNATTIDTIPEGAMYEKLKSSRKRPKTQFWFYAGANGNTDIAGDDAGNISAGTNAIVSLLNNKNSTTDGDVTYKKGTTNNKAAWRSVMPEFLEWAVGR
ncbi:MAG: alpha/beta hydrolase-fold protein [Agriterribacter sp.]